MIRTKTALAFATVALGCVGTAQAQVVEGTRSGLTLANSTYGPTGLINIPTAYVVSARTGAFSASFSRDLRVPAFNYGILPYVEIGGAFVDREGASNKAIANAKVTILPSNFNWFEIGLGIIDVADAVDQTIYFVASADLIPPKWQLPSQDSESIGLKVHLGSGTGLFNQKIFGGAELLINERMSLIAEYDSKNVNAAIRFAPTEYFRVQAGFQHSEIHLSATTTFKL